MVDETREGERAHPHSFLVVKVRYITAREPFVDSHANADDTLATLKQRVLTFFDLAEEAANGGTKTYFIVEDGVVLSDMGVTLGALSQGKHDLKLDLIERFEQG